jgi:hypothetical protein
VSKNILTKALLVLVVITLSATLLTGCRLFSKTVTVKLSGTDTALAQTYHIYVDDETSSEGTLTGDETLDITGLSIGKHTFAAESTGYSGEKTAVITGLWSITVKIPVEAD